MSTQGPRPETIGDLPRYQVTQELLRVRLTQDGACNQLLVATDQMIHVLRHSYGDEALEIDFGSGECVVTRTLDSGEQAKLLAEAQEGWDKEHGLRAQALVRAGLRLGDTLPEFASLAERGQEWDGTCGREVGTVGTCSLKYWHFGQCITVRDGKVVGTRPGPRQ